MDKTFALQINKKLQEQYRFKKLGGKWLHEGQCPDCKKWELFCAAEDPKVLKCNRRDECGYEISVRAALPDLFEDWSTRFAEESKTNPEAAAESYLQHGRGLDITGLRGHFSQETFVDRNLNINTATVRFPIGDSWWERLIDRPDRFKKKANFKFGGTWAGHVWMHPDDSITQLSTCNEIWITEGIFDCLALRQNFAKLEKRGGVKRGAVSQMTADIWPEHFIAGFKQAIEGSKNPPLLIWALDVGEAGTKTTRKNVDRARNHGLLAAGAIVRADGQGEKLDWNDLHLLHQRWQGTEKEAPLSEEKLDLYRHNGDVICAKSAREKAQLIYNYKKVRSFNFCFDNNIFWAKYKVKSEEQDPSGGDLLIEKVCNSDWRILYCERDNILDETNFFLDIKMQHGPASKARFSASAISANGEFKKRLMAFRSTWKGSQDQLDTLVERQTAFLKTVEPLQYTGYSPGHQAWVFGDYAVHNGRVIKLSSQRYFDIGKHSVKLRTDERILTLKHDPDWANFSWIEDLWAAWGRGGLIALAFFTVSLFAVHVRSEQASLGFLELYGDPNTGKTTLVTFLWKLLGRDNWEGLDPRLSTPIAVSREFVKVSGLPVGLIEGKRKDDKSNNPRQFDYADLLTLYNGRAPRTIGMKSGGNETSSPPFLGAIYLMQNHPIDEEEAVLQRIISLKFSAAKITKASAPAAKRIEKWNAAELSGFIFHITCREKSWLECYFQQYGKHEKGLTKRQPDLHNTRIIKCHAQLAAGLDAMASIIPAKFLPITWLEETHAHIAQIALERQQSSGSDHPIVQRFWDIVDHLLANENDAQHIEGKSLQQHRKADQFFAINLVEFERRARQANLQPPLDAELKKHLKSSKSRKFLGIKVVNNPANRNTHCWVFQNSNPHGPLI